MATHTIKVINLKPKMEASGWNVETLAAHFGLDKDHLWKVVSGHRNIAFYLALKLVEMFGPLVVEMNGVRFVLKPAGDTDMGDDDPRAIKLAGSRRRVRRPMGLGTPVNCMTVLREIGQLDRKLREIHECMLDVEMGKPGAEDRLITLVKEAQKAFFWIAVMLLDISERYPIVLDAGTEMACEELYEQIGFKEVDAA